MKLQALKAENLGASLADVDLQLLAGLRLETNRRLAFEFRP